jgi:hypothetical protein
VRVHEIGPDAKIVHSDCNSYNSEVKFTSTFWSLNAWPLYPPAAKVFACMVKQVALVSTSTVDVEDATLTSETGHNGLLRQPSLGELFTLALSDSLACEGTWVLKEFVVQNLLSPFYRCTFTVG